MQVVLRSATGEQDLDVVLRDPEATVADLLRAALGGPVPDRCRVGARDVATSWPLADRGLHDGAVLTVGPVPASSTAGVHELVVVGGLQAGTVLPLVEGRSTLGRGPGRLSVPGRTVSRTHTHVDVVAGVVHVEDAGSANGTRIDGSAVEGRTRLEPEQLLQLGEVALRLRLAVVRDPRARSVDRPPRAPRPAGPAALPVPVRATPPTAAPFGVATFVGGLVLAGLLAALTGQPQYAAFSLAMPLLAVGSWYESRRRARTGTVRADREHRAALDQLHAAAEQAGLVERTRLRDLAPDLGEVLQRAAASSSRLWERRTGDDDALHLRVGTGDLPWLPPLEGPAPEGLADVVVPSAPVVLDLSQGGVVGLVGARPLTLAVARSLLLQAAVQQGPADLTVAVVTDPGRAADWDWAKWLPHTRVAGSPGERWLTSTPADGRALLRRLDGRTTRLLLLDGEDRDPAAHDLLRPVRQPRTPWDDAGPRTAGVVLAATRDRLPSTCTTVVEVLDEQGSAVVTDVRTGQVLPAVLATGTDATTARTAALDLARLEDPDVSASGTGLPAEVRLLPLLELDAVDGPAVLARWRRSAGAPVAPLGVTAHGRFVLDLVRDGAHGLVGGTTGSGKSELLRTLVAGLAATCSPDDLTLVLVDYKGGAAFDACARLPHVVGLVTDLDEQLGARALLALEAELQTRERLLREVGADDLAAYRAASPLPLPRLLVVVDEFATLAAELPEFVSSLVGVAQRGRTLGVHLLLATQRPSGAVKDDIRANTNLRVALRVQDAADSSDVVGTPDAAALSRTTPGRALVRLGPGEVVAVQTALVTGTRTGDDAPLDVSPFLFGPVSRAPDLPDGAVDRPTDLARLVDAVVAATALAGCRPPRRPWPEPLPEDLAFDDLPPSERPVVALADDPRRQRQDAVGWEPSDGGLLLCGVPGSGTTTTLASLALALARRLPPDRLELQVLDAGAGDLAPLAGLPHTGSVVRSTDRARTVRLLRWLPQELDRRRELPRAQALARQTVVLVDGVPALRALLDDLDGQLLLDGLWRVFADGPEVGLSCVLTADRGAGFPAAVSAVAPSRWLFRQSESYEYAAAGLARRDEPRATPGRAVLLPSGLHAQVGRVPDLPGAVAALAAGWSGAARTATPIEVLPDEVSPADLPAPQLAERVWCVPVGVRERDLQPAVLTLHDCEHLLVTGPARSGRSTVLLALVGALHEAGAGLVTTGGRRSPLQDAPGWTALSDLTAAVDELLVLPGPRALVVDDAEGLDDDDGALARLLRLSPPGLHVVVAARADALRSAYGHWTRAVRTSRTGLLLRPDVDLDGELVGTTLPRRAPVALGPGRGYLVQDGECELVQAAQDLRAAAPAGAGVGP